MATLIPVDDSIVIAVLDDGIAEDAMLDTLLQSRADGGSSLEVHVGDPEGDEPTPSPSPREGGLISFCGYTLMRKGI